MERPLESPLESPPQSSLADLERRRTQQLVVVLIVMAGMALSLTLLAFASEADLAAAAYLQLPAFRLAPIVLTFALALYMIEQNRTLLKLTRKTVDDERTLARLAHEVRHDHLTSLPNRGAFLERLDEALAAGRRVAVLFMDLDDFKSVNDRFGHNAGDILLTETAKRLQSCLRPSDMAARFAGDEFTLLLDGVQSYHDAVAIADRLLVALAPPVRFGDESVTPSGTIGIAVNETGRETAGELIREADVAMYIAKERGRGQWTVFDPSMLASGTAPEAGST